MAVGAEVVCVATIIHHSSVSRNECIRGTVESALNIKSSAARTHLAASIGSSSQTQENTTGESLHPDLFEIARVVGEKKSVKR